MNADILWLQWQTLGNDIPMEVCEVVAEVSGNEEIKLAVSGYRAAPTDNTLWITRNDKPCPLTPEGVERLALFCLRLHSVNHSGLLRFQLCEAARWWWQPIVRRLEKAGRVGA